MYFNLVVLKLFFLPVHIFFFLTWVWWYWFYSAQWCEQKLEALRLMMASKVLAWAWALCEGCVLSPVCKIPKKNLQGRTWWLSFHPVKLNCIDPCLVETACYLCTLLYNPKIWTGLLCLQRKPEEVEFQFPDGLVWRAFRVLQRFRHRIWAPGKVITWENPQCHTTHWGAALPGEGRWLWKGLEKRGSERRGTIALMPTTPADYPRKLLRKSPGCDSLLI